MAMKSIYDLKSLYNSILKIFKENIRTLYTQYLTIAVFFYIISLILVGDAVVRSKSEASKNTYLIKLDISQINLPNTLSSKDGSTIDFNSVNISSIGLSEVYTFGLWYYCKGSHNKVGSYKIEYCSDSNSMHLFDPLEILNSDLRDSSLMLKLPTRIENYIPKSKIMSKIITTDGIVGIILMLCCLLSFLLSFKYMMKSIYTTLILGILSTWFLAITGANAIGSFSIVKRYFNNSFLIYGITADYGNLRFYILIWCSAFCSLVFTFSISMILWIKRSSRKMDRMNEQIEMDDHTPIYNNNSRDGNDPSERFDYRSVL